MDSVLLDLRWQLYLQLMLKYLAMQGDSIELHIALEIAKILFQSGWPLLFEAKITFINIVSIL